MPPAGTPDRQKGRKSVCHHLKAYIVIPVKNQMVDLCVKRVKPMGLGTGARTSPQSEYKEKPAKSTECAPKLFHFVHNMQRQRGLDIETGHKGFDPIKKLYLRFSKVLRKEHL